MKIIAIDGPAGAGKGTISKFLCDTLAYVSLDTGLFYRYLGFQVSLNPSLEGNLEVLYQYARNIVLTDLSNPLLRQETIADFASKIAIIPSIRDILTKTIRQIVFSLAETVKGVVVDGRDVSSTIFPNADLKLFITASEEIRAKRRAIEMNNSKNNIETMIKIRDERDQKRKASPLKSVDDAFIIDTTFLSVEEMQNKIYAIVCNTFKSEKVVL